MKNLQRTIMVAGLSLLGAATNALALGVFPRHLHDGTVPTPGPIAGGGILWLGVVAGAGIYLLVRRRRRD